jgi:hypothetical protein
VPNLLEVLDIRQFFQPIEDGFLDEVIHDDAARAAEFVERLLESRVDPSADL